MKLTGPRLLVATAVILSALVLQVSVLARLGLPGATPDLLLVVVLVLAMAAGPMTGTVMGFAAGVLVDLAPPAAGSIGQTAAVYALAGFIAGHAALEPGRPELRSVLTIGALAAGVCLALTALGWALGTLDITWSGVPILVFTQAIYAAILSLAVLPLVGMLYRGAADEGQFA